jgi:hypothetical protein
LRHLLNGVVQGAAAMILVVLLGVTLTPARPVEIGPAPMTSLTAQTVMEVVPSSPPLEVPWDVPQREIARARAVVAPVYPSTRVDMLSLAMLLKIRPAAPKPAFNPALLPLVDPRLDPTLLSHS